LDRRGFERTSRNGKTQYGGSYALPDGRRIVVNPTPGKGDVAAEINGKGLSAEYKGGIIIRAKSLGSTKDFAKWSVF
jgi:hypothetical protein